jgi:hypothetical protein
MRRDALIHVDQSERLGKAFFQSNPTRSDEHNQIPADADRGRSFV